MILGPPPELQALLDRAAQGDENAQYSDWVAGFERGVNGL